MREGGNEARGNGQWRTKPVDGLAHVQVIGCILGNGLLRLSLFIIVPNQFRHHNRDRRSGMEQ